MYKYKALKGGKFKAGPYNDKRDYEVEAGKEYVINVRVEQLEKDGILQLIPEVKSTK